MVCAAGGVISSDGGIRYGCGGGVSSRRVSKSREKYPGALPIAMVVWWPKAEV